MTARRPGVTYGVVTAHVTSRRRRAIRSLRAVAREILRVPTRVVLTGLCELDRRVAGDPVPAARERRRSRVAARERRTTNAGKEPTRDSARPRLVTLSKANPSRSAAGAPTKRDLPRILLLNPPRYQGIPVSRFFRSEYLFVDEHAIPATDLAYFAAAAKDKAELCLVEANAEDLTQDRVVERLEAFAPDVIVLKGLVNILEHDLAAPLRYKERHPHVRIVLCSRSTIGEENRIFEEFPGLDGIARGEIDAFAGDIAARPDLKEIPGLSLRGAPAEQIRVVEDLDEFPIPAFELMPKVWYRGAMSAARTGFSSAYYGVPSGYYLTSARGCPYTCTYCMTGGIHGRPFRMRKRDPENVVEEVRRLSRFGIRDFYFYDEIFTIAGHAEPICEKIAKSGLNVQFVCEGKPDLVTAPMLESMKRAGCVATYYGIESGDEQILRDIEKGHTVEDAHRAISLTREAMILAGAYIMMGFPGESVRSVLRTISFLLEARPDLIRYNFLMPYPVTVLHDEMVGAGLMQFDRKNLDRRINPGHRAEVSHRSTVLSRKALQALEFVFRTAFATELARSPSAS